MISSYSLHKITNTEDFGFCANDYSRFKFGDGLVAEKFGSDLAKGFIKEYLSLQPIEKQLVVVSSPYAFIPTATFAMKDHFVFQLNRWLADNNLPVVQETKVHRTITYKEDYGALNAEERLKLIGNDSFHIDRSFLEGKTVVFLDDIRITGGHERMILKMIDEYELENDIHMLYYAELINKNIHPNIENYLNYHLVKNIFDLNSIIRSDGFAINTRFVKYILNYDHNAVKVFIQNQSQAFLTKLYNMAIGNGYHTIEAYANNLQLIKNHYTNFSIKELQHGN